MFEKDATEVLTVLSASFRSVIAALGVRRPVDLQRSSGLQSTLNWQIFKLANEQSVLAPGGAVPSLESVLRFADAAEKADVVGDRTSFNSLIAAADGLSEE